MSFINGFFSQSLAWREGFLHCLSGAKFCECIDYVDEKDKKSFELGWDCAEELKRQHNEDLNRS